MQPIHGQRLATDAPRPAHVRHHTGPSYPAALHVRHGQAGRDKPLQRNARCLCMYECGRRMDIKDVPAQRLQGSVLDRGRSPL